MTTVAAYPPITQPSLSAGDRPKAVFIPFQESHALELLRLARVVREKSIFDIVFFLDLEKRDAQRLTDIIVDAGFDVIDAAVQSDLRDRQQPPSTARRQRLWNVARLIEKYRNRYRFAEAENGRNNHFVDLPPYQKIKTQAILFGPTFPLRIAAAVLSRLVNAVSIAHALYSIVCVVRELRRMRRFLASHQVALLVFCEDNVEMGSPLWVRAAHEAGVPSAVVPYTIANAREPCESYLDHPEYQVRRRILNMIAAWRFPKWAVHYKGKHFLRAPGGRVIALELLRCSPPNPWIMNSGYCTAIAVESAAMIAYNRTNGIPAEPMVLTGSLADDVTYAVRQRRKMARDELARDFGLRPDLPILVCAFPPNQLGSRPHPDFPDYRLLWQSYLELLNRTGAWNIVIKLHPRTKLSEIDVSSLGRAVICDWETAALVGLCDLYVATVSATIRWAIGCGVPVVNYDVYDYGYRDYAEVESVFTTTNHGEFEAELLRLTENPGALERARQEQLKAASHWALLDGRSGRRISELFEQLAGASIGAEPPGDISEYRAVAS